MKKSRLMKITKIENSSLRYDIEVKNTHNFFANGILVHNSNCQIVYIPKVLTKTLASLKTEEMAELEHGYITVASKGLGAQGLCMKINERNVNNSYIRATRKYWEKIDAHCKYIYLDIPLIILGEVFGSGVQDLTYGMQQGQIDFRVFDIYAGTRGTGRYVDMDVVESFCVKMEMDMCPLIYKGPYTKERVLAETHKTKSILNNKQIREGVVVKPRQTKIHQELGRVILKSINEDYLLRKNGTEHN